MRHDRLSIGEGHVSHLPAIGGLQAQHHVWDRRSIDAVDAALAAGRALLVRGEPGTGKSQLARAAAAELGRPLVTKVVDARTEAQDLLWSYDSIERLADAQVIGALGERDRDAVRAQLADRNYVRPAALWWAFDWDSAKEAAGMELPRPTGWQREHGVVVLIDEIDKADSDVPNGLLEALGNGRFSPRGYGEAVAIGEGSAPLVVVTTNEERSLPDAFVRRCLVLHLDLPRREEELIDFLVTRGRAHFQEADGPLLDRAARLLVSSRERVRQRGLSAPGQAEYLDLLRAVLHLGDGARNPAQLLDRVATYTFEKHPAEPER